MTATIELQIKTIEPPKDNIPFHVGLDFWNLIELVLVFPLHVNTTYGSEKPLESTAAKLFPSIKATVNSQPSPCALIPWSLPGKSIDNTTHQNLGKTMYTTHGIHSKHAVTAKNEEPRENT